MLRAAFENEAAPARHLPLSDVAQPLPKFAPAR
jgi:hypothetical protein